LRGYFCLEINCALPTLPHDSRTLHVEPVFHAVCVGSWLGLVPKGAWIRVPLRNEREREREREEGRKEKM
jgi:hypothetical protein